jgi:hypothetical protein
MSRNRYQLITTFLYFNNNTTRMERGQEGYDALHKIRPLLDIVDPFYQRAYCPRRELSIDESMIKFKGRLFFKQFLPLKPIRFGIKQFCLSEASSGYALKFLIYTGRETFSNVVARSECLSPRVNGKLQFSVTEQVALHLLDGDYQGNIVFTDSFYSSPMLSYTLKDRGIGHCGTVRQVGNTCHAKSMPTI